MSGRIRAKFRCLGIEHRWDGLQLVEMQPVTKSSGDLNCEENKLFWDASPSGKLSLTYVGESPYTPGDFYYIDMQQVAPDADEPVWGLSSVRRSAHGGGEVNLNYFRERKDWNVPAEPGLQGGSLLIGINYSEVVEMYGLPGTNWRVDIKPAPADQDLDAVA